MYEFYHYLPVEESIIDSGIYLTGVGRGVIPSKDKYPPAGHPAMYNFDYSRGRILPEFAIVVITDGKGGFETKQTGEITIEPNTLFLLFPDIWHRYKPNEQTGWKERWITINGIIIHQLMEQGYLNPDHPVKKIPESEQFISIFDHFLERIHHNPTENTILTSLQTMSLLSNVIELTGSHNSASKLPGRSIPKNSKDSLVNSVLEIIWTQSHLPISVDSILMQVPASRRTLERRFQKVHGHSIHREFMQCRISRAKRLLCETNLPVKKVAFLSGFNNAERMRRSFIKILQQTPSEFRKNDAK